MSEFLLVFIYEDGYGVVFLRSRDKLLPPPSAISTLGCLISGKNVNG